MCTQFLKTSPYDTLLYTLCVKGVSPLLVVSGYVARKTRGKT